MINKIKSIKIPNLKLSDSSLTLLKTLNNLNFLLSFLFLYFFLYFSSE